MTKVHDQPNDKQDNSSKRTTIRIGIFFDGTANNKDNVRLRESYDKPEERKKMTAKDIAIYKEQKDQVSYQNAVTNVVKLYDTYLFTQQSPYIKRVYIEGIGTITYKEDQKKMGLGLGYRYSGVRGKVFRGCYQISTLPMFKSKEFQNSEIIIVFDIFGFSRGAAAARNFAYELIRKDGVAEDIDTQKINDEVHANDGMKDTIDDVEYKTDNTLPKYGMLGYCLDKYAKIKTSKVQIKIRYMGLFDTVASYNNGFSPFPDFTKDLAKLHLNDIMAAKSPIKPLKTVHLTSEDEHRVNFALSKLPKTDATNIEVSFPGVHSDIGGSYIADYNEKLENGENIPIENKGDIKYSDDDKLIHYRSYLISMGWFREKEIYIDGKTLYIKRRGLSDKYADISLYYMYELCNGDKLFDKEQFYKNSVIAKDTSTDTEGFFRESIGKSYDQMVPKQLAYNNSVKEENEKNKNGFKGLLSSLNPLKISIMPFNIFVVKELSRYDDSGPYPTDQEIIYYFYNKLRKRIEGDNYEFNILSVDQFVNKYSVGVEKAESAFYFIQNKDIIITAIIDRFYYRVLRNKYLHWSSNVESTMKVTPHKPCRNADARNFNRKRYIYNQ